MAAWAAEAKHELTAEGSGTSSCQAPSMPSARAVVLTVISGVVQLMADEVVVLATFSYRHEAEFALATLQEAGIDAVLMADDAGGAYAGLSLSGQARILVRSSQLERARDLLSESEATDGSEDA